MSACVHFIPNHTCQDNANCCASAPRHLSMTDNCCARGQSHWNSSVFLLAKQLLYNVAFIVVLTRSGQVWQGLYIVAHTGLTLDSILQFHSSGGLGEQNRRASVRQQQRCPKKESDLSIPSQCEHRERSNRLTFLSMIDASDTFSSWQRYRAQKHAKLFCVPIHRRQQALEAKSLGLSTSKSDAVGKPFLASGKMPRHWAQAARFAEVVPTVNTEVNVHGTRVQEGRTVLAQLVDSSRVIALRGLPTAVPPSHFANRSGRRVQSVGVS